MKAKTKGRNSVESDELGDAWTFTAIERHTKLILAWHLGQRSYEDTVVFTEKLAYATSGSFQVTTDGFKPYRDAIPLSLGKRVNFAQLAKLYGGNPSELGRSRVRARYTGSAKETVYGQPNAEEITTSHVERHNLSIRMETRRSTRRTNAFSKKWANHHAALAFYFGYYNFCRVHGTLGKTPAMAANLTDSVWTLKNLLSSATQV
jgi:IS1 family transposase